MLILRSIIFLSAQTNRHRAKKSPPAFSKEKSDMMIVCFSVT